MIEFRFRGKHLFRNEKNARVNARHVFYLQCMQLQITGLSVEDLYNSFPTYLKSLTNPLLNLLMYLGYKDIFKLFLALSGGGKIYFISFI